MTGSRGGGVELRGELATLAAGEALAPGLRRGDLLALIGDLGAGKTTLVRGIAIGLGIDPLLVRSPTFVLHHVYRGAELALHHLDLYRLGPGRHLEGLDIADLLTGGVVAVEWADLEAELGALSPLLLRLSAPDPGRRLLELVDAPARLRARLAQLTR